MGMATKRRKETQKSGNEVFVLVNRSLRLLFFSEKLSFSLETGAFWWLNCLQNNLIQNEFSLCFLCLLVAIPISAAEPH
jgi:hypothetical protein